MSDLSQNCPIVEHDQAQLVKRIGNIISVDSPLTRKIIGIAGPPASGKSTLLTSLVQMLQSEFGTRRVIGIPMDGFHMDNQQLDLAGTRERKGAPHTFDVGGLMSLMQRLHSDESPIYAPEFDRASDLSRNCAIKIEREHDVVLVEGNYLLLDKPGWNSLSQHFDMSISIDVPNEILQQRLVQRWLNHGLTEEAALTRAQSNDIPNAQTVREHSTNADIVYRPGNS